MLTQCCIADLKRNMIRVGELRDNLVVAGCSKVFSALCLGHGKSPCFLRCCFSAVVGVGVWRLVLAVGDGVISFE